MRRRPRGEDEASRRAWYAELVKVRAGGQLLRPAFSRVSELGIRYLPYGELGKQREAIARFGSGLKPLEAISLALP